MESITLTGFNYTLQLHPFVAISSFLPCLNTSLALVMSQFCYSLCFEFFPSVLPSLPISFTFSSPYIPTLLSPKSWFSSPLTRRNMEMWKTVFLRMFWNFFCNNCKEHRMDSSLFPPKTSLILVTLVISSICSCCGIRFPLSKVFWYSHEILDFK